MTKNPSRSEFYTCSVWCPRLDFLTSGNHLLFVRGQALPAFVLLDYLIRHCLIYMAPVGYHPMAAATHSLVNHMKWLKVADLA